MRQEALEWFEQAGYDIETAQDMQKARRYVYAVFMCHLSVEKALKGLLVARSGKIPPRTHNLIYLANLIGVELSPEQMRFLAHLNTASVATRYPEELRTALREYSPAVARSYLQEARGFIQWLRQQAELQTSPEDT